MNFVEKYDLERVCYLFENADEILPLCYNKSKPEDLDNDIKKAKLFLLEIIMNDGILETSFEKGKKTNGFGRLWAKTHSIQMIKSNIRNFLFENKNVIDVDIINCACSIIFDLSNKFKIKSPTIIEYVNNRQKIIDEFYNGSKDKCKEFVNANLYYAGKRKYKNQFEKNFHNEIKQLQECIWDCDELSMYREQTIKNISQEKEYNIKASNFNLVITDIENQILQIAIKFFEKHYNKCICPMFDGFLAVKPTEFDEIDFINKLEEHIYNETAMDIFWTLKPIQNDVIPHVPNNYTYDIEYIKNQHKSINYKFNFNDTSDRNYATIIKQLKGDDFIFQDENLFIYFRNKWYKNNISLCKSVIQNVINNVANNELSNIIKKRNNVDINTDEYNNSIKLIETINAFSSKICNDSKVNSVLNNLKTILAERLDNIQFDVSRPDVFCFENIAFDLHTNKQTIIKKTDYITLNSGYNYIEPSNDDIQFIDELFNSIFPDKEHKETVKSILRTGLSATRQEKIFMFNGCGRNGKGLIDELMMDCVGNYGYKGNINVLTKEIKAGANPEVANLDKKRFVVFNEPNDNEMLNGGNIKRLTGDDKIDARGLYENNKNGITLSLTMILEVNKKPKINSRIDESLISRFVNILFKMYFTNDKNDLETLPNARQTNPFYKTYDFRQKFKCALFKYLLEHANKELYICNEVKQQTKEYLLDNDEFYGWIQEKYERTEDKKEFVSLKDMFSLYKESDLYQNLSKAMKRNNNYKHFIQQIQENYEMRKFYKDRKQYKVNGKQKDINNVIIGWKLKPQENVIIDEE